MRYYPVPSIVAAHHRVRSATVAPARALCVPDCPAKYVRQGFYDGLPRFQELEERISSIEPTTAKGMRLTTYSNTGRSRQDPTD